MWGMLADPPRLGVVCRPEVVESSRNSGRNFPTDFNDTLYLVFVKPSARNI